MKMNLSVVILGALLVLTIIMQFQLHAISTQLDNEVTGGAVTTTTTTTTGNTGSEEQLKVDFYVMSQCPYGTQVENAIGSVLDALGDSVDFNLDFIVSETAPGEFRSLHGENEVNGDIVQLCAIEHSPAQSMDMVLCMNENAGDIPNNWEACAEEAGVDVEAVRTCYEGDEGKELLSDSAARSTDIGARGSPTIYIDGKQYSGQRTPSAFQEAICNAFTVQPAGCSETLEGAATTTPTGGCG